jgi:maltooligosyltrehalose trehalohydrolase
MARTIGDAQLAQAFFGAVPSQDGVRFRLWAPDAHDMILVLHDGTAAGDHPLARTEGGLFETWIRGAAPGDTYSYRMDGDEPRPDPASRYQPQGVHGPSRIVDPETYRWHDEHWQPRRVNDLIVYELHVGTFTPEGTYAAAREKLPYLRDLGITAVEVMPIADFAGTRNWGYDGVALFAPARTYGTPDDFRAFVDAAHGHGLAVMLDVVYNHLGPEGAYLPHFSKRYLTDRHESPWGRAVNLDGPGAEYVRRFIIDNALYWVREFHVDGLRLDATHALIDESDTNIVAELVHTLRDAQERRLFLHAEDHRNKAEMLERRSEGGWGLDGVWADDFHHVVRRMVAGDSHGYFADFAGTAQELATIIRQGWLYTGQHSRQMNRSRGTSPARVPMYRFVVCVQNHDQVGNRAHGDRVHHSISAEAWRAASVVLLTAPMTPLLFMGQEWSASTPFQYFTDLELDLGKLVTEGRRREFSDFPEFSAPGATERIPDPQAASTFEASKLRWNEQQEPNHARVLALYRQLLALRRKHDALADSNELEGEAVAPDSNTLVIHRSNDNESFWIVARLTSGGEVDLTEAASALGHDLRGVRLEVVLDTEHAEFAAAPQAIEVSTMSSATLVRFARAGAVILKS